MLFRSFKLAIFFITLLIQFGRWSSQSLGPTGSTAVFGPFTMTAPMPGAMGNTGGLSASGISQTMQQFFSQMSGPIGQATLTTMAAAMSGLPVPSTETLSSGLTTSGPAQSQTAERSTSRSGRSEAGPAASVIASVSIPSTDSATSA
ncbi:unnamed protein product, partial [Protopolystoma xenopodis]